MLLAAQLLLVGLAAGVFAVDLHANDHNEGDGDSQLREGRLLRRESAEHARGRWQELLQATEGHQQPLAFESALRSCGAKARSQGHGAALDKEGDPRSARGALRALREVKQVFGEQNVPVILVGAFLLGFHSRCLAVADGGGMEGDVVTFGPWIQAAGLASLEGAFRQRGHRLDAGLCQGGPLSAGCTLSVRLEGGSAAAEGAEKPPEIRIHVLFSAPPLAVARLPGRFESCVSCDFAYAVRTQASQEQGRFFACPLPLNSFVLATWMNDTFWVPADTEQYLQAEYGSGLASPGATPGQSCSETPLAAYDSYVSSLPPGHEVIDQQRSTERSRAKQIAKAALYDRQLWRKHFPADASLTEQDAPWLLARVSPGLHLLRSAWSLSAALPALAGLIVLGAAWVSFRSLGASFPLRSLAPLIWHRSSEGAALSVHLALVLVLTFLQHFADARGALSLAAAAVLELAELLRALGTAWFAGHVATWRLLFQRAPARPPLFFLTSVPGVCFAVSRFLSFVSLCWLDPATYLLFTQASLLLAEIASRSNRSAGAVAMVFMAMALKVSKALENGDAYLCRGLACLLLQVFFQTVSTLTSPAQQADVPETMLRVCRHAQGLGALLALLTCLPLQPYASGREALVEVFNNQWLVSAMAFMLATGAMRDELLADTSTPLRELGVGGLLVKVSTLQWILLSWGGGASDLASLGLGLGAILVCLAERLENNPPPKLPAPAKRRSPAPPAAAGTRPAAAPAKAQARASGAPRAVEEARRAPRKLSIGASEVSTTAPSTPRGSIVAAGAKLAPGRLPQKETPSDSELSSDLTSDSE